MSYSFIDFFLIIIIFIHNILIKLQEYLYNISIGAKYFCFINKYVLHMFSFLTVQMGTLTDNLSAKAIIIDLLV